jgi:hypothetical protein
MTRRLPDFRVMFEALVKDPGFMLQGLHSQWEATANPVYVWEGIQICTKHGHALPDWIVSYLGQCADRMLSGDARQSPDLRQILPSILGFPRKKRGPGRPLDPDAGLDRFHFALKFALEIALGRERGEALANACNVLPENRAGADEKTLWRWLKQEFNLKHTPSTDAEWLAAARAHFGRFIKLIEKKFRETLP